MNASQCVFNIYVALLDNAEFCGRYYHRDNIKTLLDVITRLLLSSSNTIPSISRGTMSLTSKRYPMCHDDYCAVDVDTSGHREFCHFPLLRAALNSDVDVMLSVLYYASCNFAATGMESRRNVLAGREHLKSPVNHFSVQIYELVREV